jgi:periplasmic copper chaperone A
MSGPLLVFAAAPGVFAALTEEASAHIALENGQAPVSAGYKAVLGVPHGCRGSATIKVRVQIPDGVTAVKPQPKPAWQMETVRGKDDKAFTYNGTTLEEGVKEVSWSDGRLPDDFYDEFVFQGFLTDGLKPGTTIYFPVVRECEQGIERWIEIPAEGKASDDYETPAAGLKLLPNAGSD